MIEQLITDNVMLFRSERLRKIYYKLAPAEVSDVEPAEVRSNTGPGSVRRWVRLRFRKGPSASSQYDQPRKPMSPALLRPSRPAPFQ